MTIALLCPGCNGKLTAPPKMAGKKVKCPKCAQLMIVPAPEEDFEVVEDDFDVVEDTPPVKKRPPLEELPVRRKRPVLDDDEEVRPRKSRESYDVSEDDERPRRKQYDLDGAPRRKKKKKAKSEGFFESPAMKTVSSVLGGIVAIAIVGLGIWAKWYRLDKAVDRLNGKDKTSLESVGTGTAKNVSSNWVNYQGFGWSGEFPGGTPTRDAQLSKVVHSQGLKGNILGRVDGGRLYFVHSESIPGGLPDQAGITDTMFAEMAKGDPAFRITGSVTVGGFPGREFSYTEGQNQLHGRVVITKNRMLFFGVEGEASLTAGDAAVQRFINSINITS